MEELIVDGKNVLEPIDLEKNKAEIKQARNSVSSQIFLTHFEENYGIFRANVKGEDLNGLVSQIQAYFTDINKLEIRTFEEIDTLFNIIESIHKGSIEGIIVGLKASQKAIGQAEYAIEQIKRTLIILQDFKERLEENTKHLNDIDVIWETTQALTKECKRIEKRLDVKIDKSYAGIAKLEGYLQNADKKYSSKLSDHAQRIGSLESSQEEIRTRVTKWHKEYLKEMKNAQEQTAALAQKMENIEEETAAATGGRMMEINAELTALSEKQEKDIESLTNKFRLACYALGGTAAVLAAEILLNILGIL